MNAHTVMSVGILLAASLWVASAVSQPLHISRDEALKIGVKIWYNESGGTVSGLTAWNEGERFASLGIGHFTWSPSNQYGHIQESFPRLIKYLERHGITIPSWLQGDYVPPCPWRNRAEFMRAQNSPEIR